MKIATKLLLAASLLALPAQASATLVSVTGGLSSMNSGPEILYPAPSDVNDDAATNTHMQGFDERQNFILDMDYAINGGTLFAGTRVSSHMIFLNSDGDNLLTHSNVLWTFSSDILGVMSNTSGSYEVASSDFFGAADTLYPVVAFTARGLENNTNSGDFVSYLGNILTTSMKVTEPGDWIRVLTVSTVPVPAALPLFGTGLAALGLLGWRRKRKASIQA